MVYKYFCPLCGGSYICSIIKSLRCCVSQQTPKSPQTNLPVKTYKCSVMEHTEALCSINIYINNFVVLDSHFVKWIQFENPWKNLY